MRTVTHRNGTAGDVVSECGISFRVRVCASPDHGVETHEEEWAKSDVLFPDGWAVRIGLAPEEQARAIANSDDEEAYQALIDSISAFDDADGDDDPETVGTSGTDGMIPADVLDLVDDATLCAIRIASAKGEFGEAGKTAIREAFAIRHDDLDAELDVDGDRVSRTTLMLFHVTAEHARTLEGEAA